MADNTPIARFDVKAAFAALTPDEQCGLGEAALLLAYAIDAQEAFFDEVRSPASRAFEAAESAAHDILLGAVRALEIPGFDDDPPPLPDLNPFGVAQCRACGCTDLQACAGGCSWASENHDLCSRCAKEVH